MKNFILLCIATLTMFLWTPSHAQDTDCPEGSIPFFEGFENGQTDYHDLECWTQENENGSNKWTASNAHNGANRSPRSGEWNSTLQYTGGPQTWMYYPLELTEGTTYELAFYARQDGTDETTVEAAYGDSDQAEAMTNSIFSEVAVHDGEYQKFSGYFTPASTGTYYIGIKGSISSSNSLYLSIDDISVEVAQDCFYPSDLTAANITDHSAAVSWTSQGDETQWELAYGEAGFNVEANEGTSIIVNENPETTLQDLGSNTLYDAYVRSICNEETSSWANVISFSTDCQEGSIPFFEGFEYGQTQSQDLECWTQEEIEIGTYKWIGSKTPSGYNGSPRSGEWNTHLGTSYNGNNQTWMFYPLELTGGITYELTFYASKSIYYETTVEAAYGVSDQASAMTNTIFAETTVYDGDYQKFNGYFTPASTGTYYIGIKGNIPPSSSPSLLFLDDISVDIAQGCFYPSDIATANITDHSADISWTSQGDTNQWELAYGEAEFDVENDEGTSIIIDNDPETTLQDLDYNTSYDVYIRSICNQETSGWSNLYSFKTVCQEGSIPFFEGFENGQTQDQNIECWTQENENGTDKWKANTEASYNKSPRSGEWNAYLRSDSQTWMFYSLELEAGVTYELELFAKQRHPSNENTIEAAFGNEDNAAAMTETVISETDPLSDSYQKYNGYIIPGSSGTHYIGIKGNIYSGYSRYISIDDISVKVADSCLNPTDLVVTNVTEDSANISWSAQGSADQWEVVYGEEGFDVEEADAGTSIIVDDTETIIENLDYNATYDVYVRSVCDQETSVWTNIYSFTTDCQEKSIPFFEGFEHGQIDGQELECWTQEDENGYSKWTANNTETSYNRSPRSGEWNATLRQLSTRPQTWMFFPLELSGGTTYELAFYARQDTQHDNTVEAAYGDNDQAAAMTNTIFSEMAVSNGNYQKFSGTFTATSSETYYIGIKGNLPIYYSSGNYLVIDDISVEIADGCFNPTDLSVDATTDTTADISWTEGDIETEWIVKYSDTSDFDPETEGVSESVSGSPNTELDGLSPNTTYEFYVKADCGSGEESDFAGPISFETASDCIEPEDLAVDNITAESVDISWTAGGSEADWIVKYSDTPDFDPENEGISDSVSGSPTAELDGLSPNTTYEFYVKADCGNGDESDFIGPISFETTSDCIEPEDLAVDNITVESVDVSWTSNGSEIDWIVKYSDLANFNPETDGLSKTVNGSPDTELNGLSPNTTYELYIKADCGGGEESDFVGPVEFTTGCLGAPTLSFLMTPDQGAPDETFDFEVVYTNEANEMPPYGFPRVLLDYEGNGVFTNNNDRAIILSPDNPNDTNTSDGKVYVGSINQLPTGTNWEAWVQVQTEDCMTELGPLEGPKVLIAADLEIFANDIAFDDLNPEVSSPLEITATIHNKSDFSAENFMVHLENQFDTQAVYEDKMIDHLGPHESTSVVWNITTPAIPSWNPMEVFVDYTDVIDETNELNNRAIRPFTNGDFNIPGDINVQVSSSPTVVQLPSGGTKVSVSGHAYYTDTAVVLEDSTVAGATVTFVNPITGNQTQTHTNANGYFHFKTYRGSQVGIYTAPVEVTDFTITGEAPVTWELIQGPCDPDLATTFNPWSKTILEGESASGTVIVKNQGCAPVEVETLLEMNQTGGMPLLDDVTVPPLDPGESYTHDFTVQFDTPGTYHITGLADAEEVVEESSENNNLASMTIRVNPPMPDITPSGSGSKGSQYLCNASNTTSFTIKNIGYVSTEGPFDNTIEVYFEDALVETYTRTVENINPGQTVSVSIPFEFEQVGRYDFLISTDTEDDVEELSETNNDSSYYIDIKECRPNLYVSGCNSLTVDPIDPEFPGTVTYTAQVGNSGNGTAPGPVEFEFTLSNGEEYPLVYEDDILPGEQVTFTKTSAPMVSSGETVLTATVDPNELIDDTNRNNNSTADKLCWEFEPVPRCGYDFWNTIYHENESTALSVGLKAEHLYRASEVKVRFEVSGPGITGWAQLGDATVQNPTKCHGCPYSAVLPTPFVFSESGVYTFRMTSDPDDEYEECNEDNNVLIKEVTVANKPDMRVLSQYINPTLLNPDPGQSIFFHVSYENIGYSNIDDSMDLTLRINNDELAVVNNVPGLIKNTTNTIAIPVPYSSEVEGLHQARAIIDPNHDVNDGNWLNNEATRSFVVGAAANLHFNEFSSSNETPEVGETIDIDAFIANNGELDVDADILFSYISATGDTIAIGTKPVSVDIEGEPQGLPFWTEPGNPVNGIIGGSQTVSPFWAVTENSTNEPSEGGETVSMSWTVEESPVKILGEIINSSELEFDYTDNFASTQLNNFNVSLASTLSCEEQMGTLTAQAENGTPPYTYNWSNGFMGEVLEAQTGTYGVIVIDANGNEAVGTGTIEEDPDCIIPVCSLSAVSFDIPACNPDTGVYTTTVVVAYENEPEQGSITVNGTDYSITGSPQSFEVDFVSGPVDFNISFTEDDTCNLTILTGVTLEECEQDCVGDYGGSAIPGAACLDANGNPGTLDEDCFCEPDPCEVPNVSVSVVDTNGDAMDCVEEDGQYYVLIALSEGSGNTSYTVYDGFGLEADVTADGTYLAGPYDEGVSVSFTVEGNDDTDCSVMTDTVNPAICGSEPEPCEVPEVSVSVVDADGDAMDCVEEGGQYYVLIALTGGSGNESYTLNDATGFELDADLSAEGTYLAGPYDEGDTPSFVAIGNDDDACSVTSEVVDPDICGSEPEPCENPDITVSVVDAEGDSMECVDEGGQYHVLIELTEGSGNTSYTVYDGFGLETDITADGTYLAGPYDEGVSVNFTVEGNDDDACSVISDTVDPDICGSEPEPCENPDVSVSVVDADGDVMDCVEEAGQYHVFIELTGGSGNESYTVSDGFGLEADVTADGTYLAGPYDEGVSVSFTVEGNDDDACSVISDTVNPDICGSEPEPCEVPEVTVSVVDADGDAMDCVEEAGQYYVNVEVSGGSGNESYTLTDSDGVELEANLAPEGSYLAGSYDEGETVSFTVVGNDDNSCSVTSETLDPDVCGSGPEPCDDPYNANAATSDVYISSIQINGIGADIGNTDYDFNYTSGQMSNDGYDVVNNPTLTIYPGLESAYTVSSGPAGNINQYYYSVWIDLNQDGCFDADEQFIWSNDVIWGGGIPNGEPGVEDVPYTFVGMAPGTYQARIRNSMTDHPIADGNGDGEALDFTVNVITEAEADLVLGVDNQVFTDFTYYPNPVKKQLTLQAGVPINQVEVYNLLGQKVIQVKPNTLETNLDTDRLQSGVYLMNVTIDGNQKTFRVVKK